MFAILLCNLNLSLPMYWYIHVHAHAFKACWSVEQCTYDGLLGQDNRPYAYDVTEGRPGALGVKRGTAKCAIAKHAARGPTPACHTAGLTRARALTERLSANALCQHNTCSQRDKSWPPTWRRCYGDVTSMHKVYSGRPCLRSVVKCQWPWHNFVIFIVQLQPRVFTGDCVGCQGYSWAVSKGNG